MTPCAKRGPAGTRAYRSVAAVRSANVRTLGSAIGRGGSAMKNGLSRLRPLKRATSTPRMIRITPMNVRSGVGETWPRADFTFSAMRDGPTAVASAPGSLHAMPQDPHVGHLRIARRICDGRIAAARVPTQQSLGAERQARKLLSTVGEADACGQHGHDVGTAFGVQHILALKGAGEGLAVAAVARGPRVDAAGLDLAPQRPAPTVEGDTHRKTILVRWARRRFNVHAANNLAIAPLHHIRRSTPSRRTNWCHSAASACNAITA